MSAAMTPSRASLKGTGSNPLASLVRNAHFVGDEVPGPPSQMSGAQANPGWFASTGGSAPRQGFMGTVGVPPTSVSGPPASASMQPSPDEEIPNTMGMLTNSSAVFAKIARALKRDLNAPSQVGQFLFAQQERADPALKRKGLETRRYTMLNVPNLNYYMRVNSPTFQTHQEVQSAQEFLDGVDSLGRPSPYGGWAFDGVVRTEEGTEERFTRVEDLNRERMFNNVVHGLAAMNNVFGPNARPNTALFIIVKKMGTAPSAGVKVRPWAPEAEIDVPAGVRSPLPYQFEYYADYRHNTPPLKKLEYLNEFGFREYGVAYYIGRVSTHSPQNPHYIDLKRCAYDLSTALVQPMINIFVDW